MKTPTCADVQAWFAGLAPSAIDVSPMPALTAHVAGCAQCRGTLLLASAQLFGVATAIAPMSCEACQADLPAFVDRERAGDPRAAAMAYPHVWWHLWTCPSCAESYRLILVLHAASDAGTLPSIPRPKPISDPALGAFTLRSPAVPPTARRIWPQFRAFQLHRELLMHALAPQLGVAMGGFDDDAVLDEHDDGTYEIRTSIRRINGSWCVIVTLEPALVGAVVVTLGSDVFRAILDPHGEAVVGPIPDDRFTDPKGPNLTIQIEPLT